MRKHRENQAQFLSRKGWWLDESGRLWRHATLGPINGTPLFRQEARKIQLEEDRKVVAK